MPSPEPDSPFQDNKMIRGVQLAGLASGPTLFALILYLSPPTGMPPAAWSVVGMAVWMGVWWLTEAVPLAATALLPLPLSPAIGVTSLRDAAVPFANPLVFLIMAGFFIALSMERWNLHRRVALAILSSVPERPALLVAGFMVASFFLSLWVTASAVTTPLFDDVLSIGPLSDAGIAISAALVLFVVPSRGVASERLLDWETVQRAPWAILILIGGGLSLAHAIGSSGLPSGSGLVWKAWEAGRSCSSSESSSEPSSS
jgi:di/tricarboxylate transporter